MTLTILWSLALKGVADILIAALVAFVLFKSSAPKRHIAWLAGIIGLVLLPITFIGLPKWEVTSRPSSLVTHLIAPTTVSFAPDAKVIQTPSIPSKVRPATTVALPSFEWAALIPIVWWLGFCSTLLAGSIGLAKGALIARNAKTFRKEHLDGRGEIEVRVSDQIQVPSMIGWLQPVILVPAHAAEWNAEKLSIAIAHELAHVRRHDWAWQQLTTLACAIHFFNPLVWWAAKRLREESEFACDDSVIDAGIEPTQYAQELLNIAKTARPPRAALIGMASTPKVAKRLLSILDAKRSRKTLSRGAASVSLVASGLFLLPLGMLVAVVPKVPKAHQIYWAQLPHIPANPLQPISDNVYLAKDGIAALPDGLRVKLVGIAVPSGNDFWGLDGKTIPEVEQWSQGGHFYQGPGFHRWNHGTSLMAAMSRTVLVEVESEDGGYYATNDGFTDPAPDTEMQRLNPVMAGMDDKISNLELTPKSPAGGWIQLGIPKRQEKATYRFGLAGPSWRTVSKIANPIAGAKGADRSAKFFSYGFHLGDHPSMFFPNAQDNSQTVFLSDPIPAGLAKRVVLLDGEGNPVVSSKSSVYDSNGNEMIPFDRESFGKIATIELQVSPYRYAEFRDIPLRPNYTAELKARLQSHVVGSAIGIAPGFTKNLSTGGSISLEAVTKPTQDGRYWRFMGQPSWRGDGQVLATGPKIDDFTREVSVWGSHQLVRYQVRIDGPKGATTVLLPKGELDPTFWLYGDSTPRAELRTEITTEYLPSASEGSLRVGVASTPWKTVYEYPVKIRELPSIPLQEVPDPQTKPTGIEVMLSSRPELTDYSTGRKVKMTEGPMNANAMRLVAVLKNGVTKPLIYGVSGHGFDLYNIPARHGEEGEPYNNILASDLTSIRLEARPYEWVAFEHIPLNHR